MSDKNPCPFCGDDSEYLRFLDLCAERANEKWRENELRIMIDVYTSMDFVQVVRCRDCAYYDDEPDLESSMPKCWRDPDHHGTAIWTPPDGFCAWGERREG